MTPAERVADIYADYDTTGDFPGALLGEMIADAIRAAVAEEREKLVAAAERVRQALEMATVARGEQSDGARLAGWLLNGIVGGERVAVEGQPLPTAEQVAARIREGK